MRTSSARTWISDFRERRKLGRDNLRSNRFGRRSRNVLCWRTKICEIESITLRQSALHEASADRRWITDGCLGNRCGYPRREQSAKACKAKRRDPNCSDQNRTPFFKYRELRSNPVFSAVTERDEPALILCDAQQQTSFRRGASKIVVNRVALKTFCRHQADIDCLLCSMTRADLRKCEGKTGGSSARERTASSFSPSFV